MFLKQKNLRAINHGLVNLVSTNQSRINVSWTNIKLKTEKCNRLRKKLYFSRY
jgi:hypothetical protein